MMAFAMNASITATGNAGILLRTQNVRIGIDVFWETERVLAPRPAEATDADCILITHTHWDHFAPERVARAAARTGATVIGSAEATRALRGIVPPESLVTLEPALGASAVKEFPWGAVTCIRTRHGHAHNSYCIEADGFRFLHDGDNEDTRVLDTDALEPIDALFLCPWQGSGWEDFLQRLAPRYWFLIHLYEEEIAAQREDRFLTELSDCVPDIAPVIALAPGESFALERAAGATPLPRDAQ
jgi:hypothetical protein